MLKYILFIILYTPIKSFAQSDSLVFITNSEINVTRYVIQHTQDTTTAWVNDTIFQPKKNISNRYTYNLSLINKYYRVQAVMNKGNYFSDVVAYFNKPPILNIYPNTFNKTLSN